MKKQITTKRLYNIALFYLSKYEASCKQVRDMLHRRVLKAQMKGDIVPTDTSEMIETVLTQLMEQHYLSDQRFAENRVYHWTEQGKSAATIALKLKQAGISTDLIEMVLQTDESSELKKAHQYVVRKRLGFMRPELERVEMYHKDLARLARQGFSFDVASKALTATDFEEDKD